MKFSEAMKLLEKGKKVRHTDWTEKEYICLNTFGCIIDENNASKFSIYTRGEWEEYIENEQVTEQVSKSEGKYKLIDVLNKIANGELKEGTKVKYLGDTYLYYRDTLVRGEDHHLLEDIYLNEIREECELIEPQEPKECEHEWKNYEIHRIGEGLTRKYRRCEKCRLEENIEPICEHEWEKYTLGEMGAGSVEHKHRRYCKICGIDEEEPQEPNECEHEWKNYAMYNPNTGESRDFRKCAKCDLEEDIEPADNIAENIEELKQLDMDFAEIDFSSHEEYARCAIQVLAREMIKQIDKLNEVIRKIEEV